MHVQIPKPCTENWDKMSPRDQGRHCDKCAKTVVDFTAMTNHNIVEYFKNNSNTCGRFYNHQLNIDLTTAKPANRWTSWAGRIAASSLLISQFLAPKAKASQSISHGGSFVVNPSDIHETKHKRISVVINQSDSLLKVIKQLKLRFNDFVIDTLIEEQTQFSFQLPDSLSWDEIEIEITEINNDTSIIRIPYEIYAKSDSLIGSHHIRLYYDRGWKYVLEVGSSSPKWHFDGIISRGPWVWGNIESEINNTNKTDTITPELQYDFMGDITYYEEINHDSTKFDSLSYAKRKAAYRAQLIKENRWNNFWAILFFLGIGGLLAWRVIRNDKKQNESVED